jgi:uncharacterized protein (UPF0332 family)
MSYDELLRSGRIRREDISRVEVLASMKLAERDLRVARGMAGQEMDWAFAIAYNAVLQASRALMFSEGFRPASTDAHKNTLAFAMAAVGEEHRRLVTYFDRVRKKRHQAVYDEVGLVSEREVQDLLARAEEFVALVWGRIEEAHEGQAWQPGACPDQRPAARGTAPPSLDSLGGSAYRCQRDSPRAAAGAAPAIR